MAEQIERKRKISARSALLIGLIIALVGAAALFGIGNAFAQTNTTITTSTSTATHAWNGTCITAALNLHLPTVSTQTPRA